MIEKQKHVLGDGSSMYDKNGKFVVVHPNEHYHHCKIVSLVESNDSSPNPRFRTVDGSDIGSKGNTEAYVYWKHLKTHKHFSDKVKPVAEEARDEGDHYRFCLEVAVTEEDAAKGTIKINLDPFRVAEIYKMYDFAMQTMLKKVLVAGERGHKDLRQDLKDIICAAERKIEMLSENERLFV